MSDVISVCCYSFLLALCVTITPIMFIDPDGLDAIIITNKNAVPVAKGSLGHTSAVYQDANGDWFYTYWGDKAAAVIRIPSWYLSGSIAGSWGEPDTKLYGSSMSSLGDFNKALNQFLADNNLSNITSDYTSATYVVGDFTNSLKSAYQDVRDASNSNSSGKLHSLTGGSLVFQGRNGKYNAANNNCLDRTNASLGKGTLADGTSVATYMAENNYYGSMIPNNAVAVFSQIFMNSSFTYSGARPSIVNYANLYDQGSAWAQMKRKGSYARAVRAR